MRILILWSVGRCHTIICGLAMTTLFVDELPWICIEWKHSFHRWCVMKTMDELPQACMRHVWVKEWLSIEKWVASLLGEHDQPCRTIGSYSEAWDDKGWGITNVPWGYKKVSLVWARWEIKPNFAALGEVSTTLSRLHLDYQDNGQSLRQLSMKSFEIARTVTLNVPIEYPSITQKVY